MKLPCPDSNPRNARGFFLLELIVYFSLLVVIFGLATAAYWRCFDNSKRLDQNAAQILHAVDAGERWREDVRMAQSASTNGSLLTLVQAGDTIEYRFDRQSIWRHSLRGGWTVCLLNDVKFSSMRADRRQELTAWRWELEMQARKKPPFLRPLFTFEAVPRQ